MSTVTAVGVLVIDGGLSLKPMTQRIANALAATGVEVDLLDLQTAELRAGEPPRLRGQRPRNGETPAPVDITAYDLVWLRVNPFRSGVPAWTLPWLLDVAWAIEAAGVPVLNPPSGLARSISKAYALRVDSTMPDRIGLSPEQPAPETASGSATVVKPFMGTGGAGVHVVRDAREVPAADDGGPVVSGPLRANSALGVDRVTTFAGALLAQDGHPSAVRRTPPEGVPARIVNDPQPRPLTGDDASVRHAMALAPRIAADGLVHVGLDLIDGGLLEINAFAPGGLVELEELTGLDFAGQLIGEALAWAEQRRSALNTIGDKP